MSSILETIAEKTRLRVAKAKESVTLEQLCSACKQQPHSPLPTPHSPPENGTRTGERVIKQRQYGVGQIKATVTTKSEGPPTFEQALTTPGLSFICEVKKASPSKGVIAEDFPYLQIAQEYEAAGASAISVLTEPEYFLGDPRYLQEIAANVKIPVLRKDFIVDDYQLYEAKIWGAQAVLLICALSDTDTLARYIKTATELGLSALVEIHDEAEAEQALKAGARIIGINNRDLKTFNVDIGVAVRLKKLIPEGVITVAESGIKSPDDIRVLKDSGIDAALIGESLMRATDKRQFLEELRRNGE
jgi:indole-3-glycerol phosphate synthase